MSVAELMRRWPKTIAVFQRHRMACVGCAIAPFNSVVQAAEIYGIPPDTFLAELDAAILSEPAPAGWPQPLRQLHSKMRSGIRTPFPIMVLAILALLAALWAGLLRLGWQLPVLSRQLPAQHGPLMVSGFLGTLITLERVVAICQLRPGRRLYYLAPLLAGVGALALLFALPPAVPRTLSTVGSLGLLLLFVIIYRLQPTTEHLVMGLGAGLWLAGNLLWLAGLPLHRVVPWWAGFLILTIAGERLELARILMLSRLTRSLFVGIITICLAGLLLSFVEPDAGLRLFGIALVALGAWLLRFDIARRTIRRPGLTRFIAACLLAGYLWLMVGGVLWLIYGGHYAAGPIYDAILHTIFLGFVFSLIFGHAPIIVPAVLGTSYQFTPFAYLHLALLHLSLTLRLVADLIPWLPGRRWGGLLNEMAVLLFMLMTVLATRRASR